jgi:mannose-1-phosphate guanylyltransferase
VDIRMVPLDAGWNDLGAWDAVWQVTGKDDQGNAATGDVLLHDSQRTLVHRLANPGKVWLEIIEVQSGSYLGEDDIVRFEDTYGR